MSYGKLIRHASAGYALDSELVAALIIQESGGDKWAWRFEEKWFAAKLLALPRNKLSGFIPSSPVSLYDEKIWRAHSYGLMQVLGETARVLGFSGQYMSELFEPIVNLSYGCQYLSRCFVRAARSPSSLPMERQALIYYNGGVDYPDAVLRHIGTRRVIQLLE